MSFTLRGEINDDARQNGEPWIAKKVTTQGVHSQSEARVPLCHDLRRAGSRVDVVLGGGEGPRPARGVDNCCKFYYHLFQP